VKHTMPWLPAVLILATLLGGCERGSPAPGETEGTASGNGAAGGATTSPATASGRIVVSGPFATPESVLHDPGEDIYLVSNINGEPAARDNNGFITRVRPDGGIETERWIEGGRNGLRLNAPKGMALKGDTLFVADIDTVRAFHRTSGEPLVQLGVPGASFLNDLVVGPDGTLYVTDSGLAPDFSSTGTDAIYAFHGGQPHAIASGPALASPNGLVMDGDALIMVPFGSRAVFRLLPGQAPREVAQLPAGQLDGVVRLADGSFLISSWQAEGIFRLSPSGAASLVMEDLPSPADIGLDLGRNRVLIPLFLQDRIEIRAVAATP
jgi:hypothetical protein